MTAPPMARLGGQFARLLPGYVCKEGPAPWVSDADTAATGGPSADAKAASTAAACEAVKVGHCSDPRTAMCGHEAPPRATRGMSQTLHAIRASRHWFWTLRHLLYLESLWKYYWGRTANLGPEFHAQVAYQRRARDEPGVVPLRGVYRQRRRDAVCEDVQLRDGLCKG
jgi:hypothetical protein